MAVSVLLRSDFNAGALRALVKGSRDPDQTPRLLTLSAIYAGRSRSKAASIGGWGLMALRRRRGVATDRIASSSAAVRLNPGPGRDHRM